MGFFNVKTVNCQTANVSNGCAPLNVNFSPATGLNSYFWDFKDGSSSTLSNPSNTFTTPGTYVVELRETPTSAIIGTITIIIYNKPTINFTALSATNGCPTLAVELAQNISLPTGITATNYIWTFGNGTGATGDTVTAIYPNAGNYSISLQLVSNSASCNTAAVFIDTIKVNNKPVANFATNPANASACVPPLNVSFINSSTSSLPLTYQWNLGNGNTSTALNPPAQNYTANGSFPVTLIVTDAHSCTDTLEKIVRIGAPTSAINAPDTVCVSTPFNVINLSTPGTYNYQFTPGYNLLFTSNPANRRLLYNTSGLKTISLRTTSNPGGCFHDTSIQVYVDSPFVSIAAVPDYSCEMPFTVNFSTTGSTNFVNFAWDFDNGLFSSANSPITIYNENFGEYDMKGADSYTVSLQGFTAQNCPATATSNIEVFIPRARFMPDKFQGCAPLTVAFYDSSKSKENIIAWDWDFGDGSPILSATNGNSVTHTFQNPGIYEVYLHIENNLGCADSSYKVVIEVGDSLPLSFEISDSVVCAGTPVILKNTTSDSLGFDAWHFSSGNQQISHCSNSDSISWVFDSDTGFFDITLTGIYRGCETSKTINQGIYIQGPIANFNFTQDCSQPNLVNFESLSKGATSTIFLFGDGDSSMNAINSHSFTQTGDYAVQLIAVNNQNSCENDTDKAMVHIRNVEAHLNHNDAVCAGDDLVLDASNSIDVYNSCGHGFTYYFDDPSLRPITTAHSMRIVAFDYSQNLEISLVVTDINGCTDTAKSSLQVSAVTAKIDYNSLVVCSPDSFFVRDSSISDTSIAYSIWNFGNLFTDTAIIGAFYYASPAPSPHRVYLRSINQLGCSSIDSVQLFFYQPVSTISNNPSKLEFCVGDSISFSATDDNSFGTGFQFIWDFRTGDSAFVRVPKYAFDSAGTYQVILNYSKPALGCSRSDSIQISVENYPKPVIFSNADTLAGLCGPLTLTFNSSDSLNAGVTLWNWNLGNGQIVTGQTVTSIYSRGTYDVSLIGTTAFGCADSTVRQFKVISPEGDFDVNKTTLCKDDSILFTLKDTADVSFFQWDFGDGSNLGGVNPVWNSYNFIPPTGTTVAKLTIYGPDSTCPNTAEKIITIEMVIAEFERNNENDTGICFGEMVNLQSNSVNADNFIWTLNDGNVVNDLENFNHRYLNPGIYQIQLFVSNLLLGCKDSISKTVIVHKNPTITAFGDTVCEGENFKVTVDSVYNSFTYNWNPATNFLTGEANKANALGNSTESLVLDITVLDSNNCQAKDSTFVLVVPRFEDFEFDTIIVLGDSIVLPLDLFKPEWITSYVSTEVPNCGNCNFPTINPSEFVVYTLNVADTFGCFSAIYEYRVEIHPETFISLPTTFTPNGDGVNDVISVEGWGLKELEFFRIYNRWGQLIFESNDIQIGWDGTYNGVVQNSDIYIYQVSAITFGDESLQKEGHINLKR